MNGNKNNHNKMVGLSMRVTLADLRLKQETITRSIDSVEKLIQSRWVGFCLSGSRQPLLPRKTQDFATDKQTSRLAKIVYKQASRQAN